MMAISHLSLVWRGAPCSGASLLALLSLADNAGGSGDPDDPDDLRANARVPAVAHAARVNAAALQHILKALEVDGLIAELTIEQNRVRYWLARLEPHWPALTAEGNHR